MISVWIKSHLVVGRGGHWCFALLKEEVNYMPVKHTLCSQNLRGRGATFSCPGFHLITLHQTAIIRKADLSLMNIQILVLEHGDG